MILRFLNWLAAGRRYFMIENFERQPYLLRLLLRGRLPGDETNPSWSAYLHRFYRHDEDRHLHNHPWTWSFSIILWGGYVEERRRRNGKIVRRRVWPGTINLLGPKDFHRVLELKGSQTWTLFITGGKASAWGFLVDGVFILAKAYLKAKGLEIHEGEAPIPDWMLTCACCQNHFPPPGNYYVRTPVTEGRRIGVRLPVCDACARLPYATHEQEDMIHA